MRPKAFFEKRIVLVAALHVCWEICFCKERKLFISHPLSEEPMARPHHYLDESFDTISHLDPPADSRLSNDPPLKMGYPEELPKPSPPQGAPEKPSVVATDWWMLVKMIGTALSGLVLLLIIIL
jgi:hypothetical protein